MRQRQRGLLLAFAIGLIALTVLPAHVQVQPQSQSRLQSSSSSASIISGYAKDVRGEIARHESPHPDARSVLVAHAGDPAHSVIEWESAAVPETASGPVTFAFVWGMSGAVTPQERWRWDLFVGDTKVQTIENLDRSTLGGSVSGTVQTANAGTAPYAEWRLFWNDRNGNPFGHLYLTVPPALYTPGRAVRMRIAAAPVPAGGAAPPDAWLMVFRYETRAGVTVRPDPALLPGADGMNRQQLRVAITHYGTRMVEARVSIGQSGDTSFAIEAGYVVVRPMMPVVTSRTRVPVTVRVDNRVLFDDVVTIEPVKPVSIYLLHHSHLDIGYTHVQSDVAAMQAKNLEQALALIEKTRGYDGDSQFRWNVEGFWSIEAFLAHASAEQQRQLREAMQAGRVEIGPLYGNMLTGLAQPEELIRMTEAARSFARGVGVPLESAWISDVPGYSWGIVPALAQRGIKYFSFGTNTGDRIGHIIERLGDRPFYWRSASGQEKVLCWLHANGYSYFHTGLNYVTRTNLLTEDRLFDYLRTVQSADRPSREYGELPLRYNIGSDNGPPDDRLSDLVRDWNRKYSSPRLVISTITGFFKAFEAHHGATLPTYEGELTPYWEDGAYSTARESIVNQAAAARLEQAETFWALRRGRAFPADRFREAWRSVLLFNEHTWGSWNSISAPESRFTKSQWATKAAFATDADRRSRELLDEALPAAALALPAFDVFNSLSWPRTDLVTVPGNDPLLAAADAAAADRLVDAQGRAVPSQRLSNGDLAFLAQDVPALGTKRFRLVPRDQTHAHAADGREAARRTVSADAERAVLAGNGFSITLDPATGAIRTLTGVPTSGGLNRYIYQAGRQPADEALQSPSDVRITVGERGPLVASLLATSAAPGTDRLWQEVRLIAGVPRVDIINKIDKRNVYDPEAVYFAFPFGIPDPRTRVGVIHGFYRPERQQLPGSCKNYFTMRNWIDVSSATSARGVTLVSPDAPMVELSRLTTDANRVGWLEHVNDSATVFSYVMNNFWGTNYKAGQDGFATFRYALVPHARFDAARAYKAGLEATHPLVVRAAAASAASADTALTHAPFVLRNRGIIVSAMKPSDDGKGVIVRLFNASERAERPLLQRGSAALPLSVSLVDGDDRPTHRLDTLPVLPPFGLLTIFVENAPAPATK